MYFYNYQLFHPVSTWNCRIKKIESFLRIMFERNMLLYINDIKKYIVCAVLNYNIIFLLFYRFI